MLNYESCNKQGSRDQGQSNMDLPAHLSVALKTQIINLIIKPTKLTNIFVISKVKFVTKLPSEMDYYDCIVTNEKQRTIILIISLTQMTSDFDKRKNKFAKVLQTEVVNLKTNRYKRKTNKHQPNEFSNTAIGNFMNVMFNGKTTCIWYASHELNYDSRHYTVPCMWKSYLNRKLFK